MSLTRKMLKGMSLTEEQIDSIIENHTETVNGLKDEIAQLTEEKETLAKDKATLTKENKALEKFKEEHSDDGENEWQTKYNDLKAEHDKYKADVEAKETERKNKSAYRSILKEAGIMEDKIDTVLKVAELNKLKYDKDGKLENKDDLLKEVKEEWKALIPTTRTEGASVQTPPSSDGSSGGSTSNVAQRIAAQRASMYGKIEEK